MIRIDRARQPRDLLPAIDRMFELSAAKIDSLERSWSPHGAPVFTVQGRYTARGWTEWTEGFVYGAALLQYDATGDRAFLELGRRHTLERMAPHLTHVGVHDHGFNNVSTYGTLWRLAREGRIDADPWQVHFYELALKVSGAVQARRWTPLPSGGFIHSFNGAHSLFVDTIRSLRALALSSRLGHRLIEEQDLQVNLIERLLQHAHATARFGVYFGRGRDTYRPARPSRARVIVQRCQRHVPWTQQPARVFAVLDLDAWTRLGDAGFRRTSGVSRNLAR